MLGGFPTQAPPRTLQNKVLLWRKQTAGAYLQRCRCSESPVRKLNTPLCISLQLHYSECNLQKYFFFITKHLFEFSYIGKVECAQQWGLLAPNITNPTWFLKMRSLVSSSSTRPRLLVRISQISLLCLLLLDKEDQMQGTHANRDMMWHVVKWASIMHTPSRRGSA